MVIEYKIKETSNQYEKRKYFPIDWKGYKLKPTEYIISKIKATGFEKKKVHVFHCYWIVNVQQLKLWTRKEEKNIKQTFIVLKNDVLFLKENGCFSKSKNTI